MAKVWLKKLVDRAILTIEFTSPGERECVNRFCNERERIETTLTRFERRHITVLDIEKGVT